MNQIAELLKTMTRELVDHPDDVCVALCPQQEGDPIKFEVFVLKSDLGQAIGKEGRIANAVRQIVKASARKHKLGRIHVEFLEATP